MRRFAPTREQFIPAGAVKVADKHSDGVAYIYNNAQGLPCAVVFHGKAQKPDWKYRFQTLAAREARIRDFFEQCQAHARRKAEERAKASKPHGLEVGHVLVASWGYEQTNVDFYQVTRVIGPRTVELRAIGNMQTEATGHMSGKTMPAIDQFTGEPMIKRVTRGYVRIDDVRSATLWDGLPRYESWYH